MLVLDVLCAALAFYICRAIFSLTGPPAPLPHALIVSAAGLAIVFILFRLVGVLMHKNGGHDKQHRLPRVWTDTFEALDRISGGDFDVLIEGDSHDYYNELVTRINKLAQDLKSMEQLRQDFVSNVSHEIQSPLTSIAGYAALLRGGDLGEEKRSHYLDIMEAESRRLSGLSDNLLKLSALDAGRTPFEPAPYRLDKQLEEILLLLEPQWSVKNIELEIDLQEATVTGDRDLLSQVWINLLHNAIKFSGEGGAVSVRLSSEGGDITCIVKDNGIGIPEEDLPRIFERFYKADKSRGRNSGGNGLGLSLVRKIVHIHGGRVRADSTAGQGAVFTVTLRS
jgi:signal transduction histidine kinase